HDIANLATGDVFTLKKFRSPKNRVLAPHLNQFAGELKQTFLFFVPLPVQPTDLIVLTIGVVVSLLRSAELVAAQEHWHSLRQKQHRQKIALLLAAQILNLRIVSRTFGAAVPGTIMRITVTIFLTIAFIVLLVVADEIVQGESIMRGN